MLCLRTTALLSFQFIPLRPVNCSLQDKIWWDWAKTDGVSPTCSYRRRCKAACLKAIFQLRFEYDTTSYEEPTRSYAHSSNNEHVNSFALLYVVVANQRVGGGASAMT